MRPKLGIPCSVSLRENAGFSNLLFAIIKMEDGLITLFDIPKLDFNYQNMGFRCSFELLFEISEIDYIPDFCGVRTIKLNYKRCIKKEKSIEENSNILEQIDVVFKGKNFTGFYV